MRIHNMPSKKLSEFAFKMIHKLIPSRDILCKWKHSESNTCPYCNEVETVKQIYYDCVRINQIWVKLSETLKTNITWKKIIIGQYQDITVHRVHILLINVILFSIYKFWIKGTQNPTAVHENIENLIKRDVYKWKTIICESSFDKNHRLFYKIWQMFS